MTTKPLPDLTDAQWAALNHLADSQLNSADPKAMRTLLGLPTKATIELRGEFAKLVETDGSFYYIKGPGLDAVAARRRLLDPQTLADRLKAIQSSMESLLSSGLNRRAIVVLLKDRCSTVNKGDIEAVLDALGMLAAVYTTPPKGAGKGT